MMILCFQPCYGTLTLFTMTYLRGEELEMTENNPDLGDFSSRASSMKITGEAPHKNDFGQAVLLMKS